MAGAVPHTFTLKGILMMCNKLLPCFLLLALGGCRPGQHQDNSRDHAASAPTAGVEKGTDRKAFPLPDVPLMLTTPAERRDFLLAHYWQNFDFADTTLLHNADITEQGWGNYLAFLSQPEVTPQQREESLDSLCTRMEVSAPALTLFLNLAEQYLDNPNSPYYNEGMYSLFLRRMLSGTALDDARKSTLRFKLALINRNMPGSRASDFSYVFPDGSRSSLFRTPVRGNRLLLVFYDPECPSCHKVLLQMCNDTSLAQAVSAGKLTVLAVYTEDNQQAWKRSLPDLPSGWLVATDRQAVKTDALYDLKAMPSLYLLDAGKKVLLKDAPYPLIRQTLGL